MTKTLVFYGNNAGAAKEQFKQPKPDTFQYIQADAYQGERLEADQIEFMDDVDPGQRARIESIWGKFDNRVSHDPALVGGPSDPTSHGGVQRTPGSDRRNLTDRYRVDNPDEVEAKELDHPAVAPKSGVNPAPGTVEPKAVGLDAVTGNVATDRNVINRDNPDASNK